MESVLDIEQDVSILYVEDEQDAQEGYAKVLQRFCSKLYIANDGKEGLKLYKEHNPDIVVSDINMPVMNGIDMVKAIREIDPHKCCIIFTTAHSDSGYLFDAIELGINSYLIKPVEKNLLKQKIEKAKKIILEEKQIEVQQSILQNILDVQKNPLIVTDFKKVLFANRAFLNIYNLKDVEDFNSRGITILDIFLPISNYIHQGMIKKDETFYDLVDKTDEDKRSVTLIGYDGQPKAYNISLSHIDYKNSSSCLMTLTDITKRNIQKIDAEKKAYYDSLTGIYNRAKFDELFDYEINRVKRYGNDASVVILDIDHFKKFNDRYGHLIGDEVLILLSKVISENIRKTDIFARWGGEEFVLLLQETKPEDAQKIVEKLRSLISNTHHKSAGEVTASFGITGITSFDTIESALKRCDIALYRAKENGRNRVETFLDGETDIKCI